MTTKISKFDIEYSFWLEEMHYTFWRRVDASINIALIILGTSVAASLQLDFLVGLAVAILAAINVVIQPLKKSMQARSQAEKFGKLLSVMDDHEAKEFNNMVHTASEHSSDPLGAITALAFNRAAIRLGLKPNYEYTFINKLVGHFIGDLPDSRP
ncbi:hypothetical protein [Vibrio sp. CyArs1]|uniref:hypothetical protein n=1 Tax=Vibrio sp. CyArs1 TaxID=2682577 RepID=UPI001F063CB4|nr:hypothetical protein [Vibrio sp. CyArs1]